MSGLYEELCNLFIKPARQSYSDHDLGPTVLAQNCPRLNFSFPSHKGHEIKASLFINGNKCSDVCVVYLHSFNGSRLQSLRYAAEILERGFHFCSFDFAGCGNSGGEYVTLGCNQRWDVLKLFQTLQEKYGFKEYFLWGRSMGAVTAIKCYSLLMQEQRRGLRTNTAILGLILDSAFISLRRLVAQVGSRKSSMPQFIVKAAFLMVSSSIEQRAGFSIDDLNLQKDVEAIRCSTLLIASSEDTFVGHEHSEEIFSKLKLHDKEIIYTKGEHYEQRDRQILNTVYSFLQKNARKYGEAHSTGRHHINQDQSTEKVSNRSLKSYEPKPINSPKVITNAFSYQSDAPTPNCARILFRSNNIQRTPQFRTDKKTSIRQSQFCERQYQTQKRIPQFNPKVSFATTAQHIRNHDEIKNSNKPTIAKRSEPIQQSENIRRPIKGVNIGHDKNANQESHCNVIADRLRKNGKHHKQNIVECKNNISFQANSTHLQQKGSGRTKVLIHVCNPSEPILTEKQAKRASMTAQQYKNTQIKKGCIALSPHARQRQEPNNLSQFKLKAERVKENQAKSMTNLFAVNEGAEHQKINYAKVMIDSAMHGNNTNKP